MNNISKNENEVERETKQTKVTSRKYIIIMIVTLICTIVGKVANVLSAKRWEELCKIDGPSFGWGLSNRETQEDLMLAIRNISEVVFAICGVAFLAMFAFFIVRKVWEKEQAENEKKAAQQKAEQEAREKRREDIFVKVGEVNYSKGNELRHLYDDSVAIINKMLRNIYSRPLDLKPIYHDPILRGGLASGMAGTAAGVYTAIKTDEENRAAKEAYKNSQDKRIQIEVEAYPIYREFLSTERKMMDILKETLGENCGEFIYNYKSSLSEKSINLITDLCAEHYSKATDENSQLCIKYVEDRISHIEVIYRGVAWDKNGL